MKATCAGSCGLLHKTAQKKTSSTILPCAMVWRVQCNDSKWLWCDREIAIFKYDVEHLEKTLSELAACSKVRLLHPSVCL